MQFDLVIRNGTLVTPGGRLDSDVGVRDGRISAVGPRGSLGDGRAELIDARGLIVLPGLIDAHVHFRDPGLEYKEDWETGSRAAVMGGVTTVLEMPNTVPPTDSVERLRDKLRRAAARSYCDFGLFGLLGASAHSVRELAASAPIIGLKVFLGPSTGELAAPSHDALRDALSAAAAAGLRVAAHCEDRDLVVESEARLRTTGRTDARAHLDARTPEAEVVAIETFASALAETGAAGHVLHLSSADGLMSIRTWRDRGVDLTCEVTPHHLMLAGEVYELLGGVARVNPPVRGEPHATALRDALAAGDVDIVGSDHAPHTPAEKSRRSIWDVPAGFPGVETLLPLLLTHAVRPRQLTLERLAYVTSEGPARAWDLWPRKGSLSVGADADFTLVDLDHVGVIRGDALHGKNNLSPFEGWETVGAPVTTIIRGRVVMRDGDLCGESGYGQNVVAR